jgi:hypothetical protein
MWGRVARRYLTLPAQGYHIATSIHADTIDDVIFMYHHDLHLRPEDVRRLGLVVNIGLVGRVYPQRRRWLSTNLLQPTADLKHPDDIVPIPLSLWNEFDDTFEHADQSILDDLAQLAAMPSPEFSAALKRRSDCLQELAQQGVDVNQMYDAIQEFRKCEKKNQP